MGTLKRQLVKLAALAALALLASMLEAQGPPNACANAYLQTYKAAVRACDGNAACLAAAREAAKACIASCNLQGPCVARFRARPIWSRATSPL